MAIRFHSSIVKSISESNFRPSDDDIVTLVQTKVKAGAVDEGIGDTYFGVLVGRTQDKVSKYADTEATLKGLDAVHKELMVLVNKGAITPEVQPNKADDSETKARKHGERQRRTGFARSAASTLRRWISAGGNIHEVDAANAKKSRFTVEAKEAETEAANEAGLNTPEGKVAKRLASLITALQQVDEATRGNVLAETINTLKTSVVL
jgi:hypothetical protein